MQFAAVEQIGLVDMIIPRLCLNSVALSGIRTTSFKNCSPGSFFPPGLQHFIAYPSGFAPAILDTASIQGSFCHLLCLQNGGCSAPAPQAEKRTRRRSAGHVLKKGGLPACPWRRQHGSRNAGKGKEQFRRKNGWRRQKRRALRYSLIMLARKVNRTEASLRKCAALSFICT